jgi:hypothetical protein
MLSSRTLTKGQPGDVVQKLLGIYGWGPHPDSDGRALWASDIKEMEYLCDSLLCDASRRNQAAGKQCWRRLPITSDQNPPLRPERQRN